MLFIPMLHLELELDMNQLNKRGQKLPLLGLGMRGKLKKELSLLPNELSLYLRLLVLLMPLLPIHS
jgi:hypothetical protein